MIDIRINGELISQAQLLSATLRLDLIPVPVTLEFNVIHDANLEKALTLESVITVANGTIELVIIKVQPIKTSTVKNGKRIAGIACVQSKASFQKTMQVQTALAIGLMDGFLCCWDEKYRSNRIRPETAIRKYIDPNWKPFLQTPPFPEYLSGHSTISSTAAVILTHFFGPTFVYEDTVEERFGLKSRHFGSFKEAADEAGISRFYGGIHFMDAIENGQKQGLSVGEQVLRRIR